MTEGYYNGRNDRRRSGPKMGFSVRLTCGHEVKTRTEPLHPGVKLGCTWGLGCGYFLHWVKWTDLATGRVFENGYKPPADDETGNGMIPEQRDGDG